MSSLAAVVLAAGRGTRMRCKTPKVIQPVAGRPMILYTFELAASLQAAPAVVVVRHQAEPITQMLPAVGWRAVEQTEQLGTGHAMRQTEEILKDFPGDVLVLHADVPLLRAETLQRLV
jgi:bifunctional UDP-N-acetylglucosamine pyrophosphorylase / glucosamine-1-phosphate N-acetyltransferase